jgi:TRAP-type C4-dicarboxylate transport system permease small subunit
MNETYRRLAQGLYLGCIVLSGVAMVAITIMIPIGVFMRYVMNNPLQWPEPASVIMMVFFSCMLLIAGFMLVYGIHLCYVTRGNTIAEFPWLSTGIVYMPIPLGGLLTLLFIIEKIWLGEPPADDVMYSDAPAELE